MKYLPRENGDFRVVFREESRASPSRLSGMFLIIRRMRRGPFLVMLASFCISLFLVKAVSTVFRSFSC